MVVKNRDRLALDQAKSGRVASCSLEALEEFAPGLLVHDVPRC